MPNRVIYNADDFGMTKSVNAAIVDSFKKGYLDRTTIMVNMPFFEEAKALSQINRFEDKVGLHLNLTQGTPVLAATKESCLCDEGFFNGELLKRKYLFFLNKKLKTIVQNEVEAQIAVFLAKGFTLKHLDSHQHLHERFPIFRCIRPVLIKYGFYSVRVRRNVFTDNRIGFWKRLYTALFNFFYIKRKPWESTKYLCALSDLKNGFFGESIEVMVHPNFSHGCLVDDTDNSFFTGRIE